MTKVKVKRATKKQLFSLLKSIVGASPMKAGKTLPKKSLSLGSSNTVTKKASLWPPEKKIGKPKNGIRTSGKEAGKTRKTGVSGKTRKTGVSGMKNGKTRKTGARKTRKKTPATLSILTVVALSNSARIGLKMDRRLQRKNPWLGSTRTVMKKVLLCSLKKQATKKTGKTRKNKKKPATLSILTVVALSNSATIGGEIYRRPRRKNLWLGSMRTVMKKALLS